MTASPKPRLYFVNAAVDWAVIGGGSILVFTLLRLFHSGQRAPEVTLLAAALLWVCNWPHFSATSYRLYHSLENVKQYPMTALAVPWIVLAGVAGSLASPAVIAPYFIKLFTIWSPYHFSGQTVGITLIYARRAGLRIRPMERFALSGFVYGTFLSATIAAEVSAAGNTYYGISYPGFGLPAWVAAAATVWMWLCGAAFLGLLASRPLAGWELPPAIVLLPAASQYVWFVGGSSFLSFVEFVPFFHSLQYLLIAWSLHLKEKKDRLTLPGSATYVWSESLRWAGLNMAGGACLFFIFPKAVSQFGFPLEFATGVAITGVQLHHFFVDGVIWKLRSRTVSSPLMGDLPELLGAHAV